MKELTNEDIQKVMETAGRTKNPDRDKLVMALSIKAGMTTANIAHLKIGDVMDSSGQIKEEVTIGKRTVLLNTEVRRLTEAYLTVRFSRSLNDIVHLNNLMSDHIYPLHLLDNNKRGYFDEWTLPTVIASVYKQAGVESRPSIGRTTYIRRLVKQGLSMNQLTKLSGMTAEAVAKYLDKDQRDVRELIEMM